MRSRNDGGQQRRFSTRDGAVAAAAAWRSGVEHHGRAYVALPSNWESFTASLGKKRRQSLKYAIRDFEAWAGERGYKLHRAHDLASLERGLEIVRKFHAERWRAAREEGAFARPRFRAFHDEIAPALFAAGRANVLWLTVGGEPVAGHYHFRLGDRVYFYQSGRMMQVPKTVRLGIVMMALAVRDAIEGACGSSTAWADRRPTNPCSLSPAGPSSGSV